jgi:integrase
MSKSRKKRMPKRVLALPDLEQAKSAVLDTLTSVSGQRTYDHAIKLTTSSNVLLRAEPGLQSLCGPDIPHHLEQKGYAPNTINLRLAAVRRVAYEACDSGLLSAELGAGIRRVKVVRRLWCPPEQLAHPRLGARFLLERSDIATLRGKRNHAILAMLIGCGLRRGELLSLAMDSIRVREEHWAIADLKGKAGHVRTALVPQWLKAAVDVWSTAAGITEGTVFRSINKSGRVWGDGMTLKVVWEVVKEAASRAGIQKLVPHDLRRTCARLSHLASGELDQIQVLLGHVSIQTTERYLGCKQRLSRAVNDKLGIEPECGS